jgi:hypothetical protein
MIYQKSMQKNIFFAWIFFVLLRGKIIFKMEKLKIDTNTLLGTFGLTRNTQCELLDELLLIENTLNDKDVQFLEKLRIKLLTEGDFWNEEELKMRFLAFLFDYAQIDELGKIKIFYERPLTATLNGHKINVKCDCLVAKPFGIGEPDIPYFFLQEAPTQPSPEGKEKKSTDAEGQMLAAMLLALDKNKNRNPVYGCYLQGKNWTFTTLHDKNYCISRQYDATQVKDIQQILLTLKNLKYLILNKLS